jgi:hypothetical protein
MSGPDYLALLRTKNLESGSSSDVEKNEKTSFCTLCSSPVASSDCTSRIEAGSECDCHVSTSDWWIVYLVSSPEPIVITASRPSDEISILAAYKGKAIRVERTKPQVQKPQKVLSGQETARLRSWMSKVGITDQPEIDRIIGSCEVDAKERALILSWADEIELGIPDAEQKS